MTIANTPPTLTLPDHTQLPESDGTFVKNFQEHPQSILLTTSIKPTLNRLHPDGQYSIGQDTGIYWRIVEPLERGAEAPDWCYIPNVPPMLNGEIRRSYVLWKEKTPPIIAIEFVSGSGKEERDRTDPLGNPEAKAGKFWVYEQAAKIPYYAIYEVQKAAVEVYELIDGQYQQCQPNDRGHYEIHPIGVELGIWQGEYANQTLPWLRWWDNQGNLLLCAEERADQQTLRADQQTLRADQEQLRADQEKLRADQEKRQAEEERQRSQRLADRLRELGIDPDAI